MMSLGLPSAEFVAVTDRARARSGRNGTANRMVYQGLAAGVALRGWRGRPLAVRSRCLLLHAKHEGRRDAHSQ
jgi:hypothetical protein